MVYGYARVSTIKQKNDGNSLEVQEIALRDSGVETIFVDACSGKNLDRPKLIEMIKLLKSGDTMTVTKLDRLSRSSSQGCALIDSLLKAGVSVNILNMGLMDNTSNSRFMRNTLFGFAEFERDQIVERTQEGKAIARQRPDFKEGRPRVYTDFAIASALQQLTVNGGKYSYNQVARLAKISKSTLIRAQKQSVDKEDKHEEHIE